MLDKYYKIVRGKSKPRFLTAKASMKKELEKIEKSKQCVLCSKEHKLPSVKVKISTEEDPTFRNATTLTFSSKGASKTAAQVAATVAKNFAKGKKTLIVSGDVVHGLPFLIKILNNLKVFPAVVITSDPLYSAKSLKLVQKIADVHAPVWRFANPGCAEHFGVDGYVDIVKQNIAALKPEIVRIPLMPGHLECDAKPIMQWIAIQNPNILVQLVLAHAPQASERAPELGKTVTITDLHDVAAFARQLGLNAESIASQN